MKTVKPAIPTLVAACLLLAPTAHAAVVFSDNFSTGSTLNSATPSLPSAGSAAYHLVSSKAWSPAPTLAANNLRFGLAANANDFIEVQARFARAVQDSWQSNNAPLIGTLYVNVATAGRFTEAQFQARAVCRWGPNDAHELHLSSSISRRLTTHFIL